MDFVPKLALRQSIILTLSSSAVAVVFLSLWWWKNGYKMGSKRSDRQPPPIKPCDWRLCGHLTEVKLYPLKSGHAVDLSEAEATPLGLKSGLLRDRFFIVFDESANFVTGRKYPEMVLITVTAQETGNYIFSAPGCKALSIQIPESSKEKKSRKFKCRLWTDRVCGIDTGDDAAIWISQFLLKQNNGLRIGYYEAEFGVERSVSPLNQAFKLLTPEDTGAFSDLSSFLLISEDSVSELNGRLGEDDQVSCANFRPNLVFKGIDDGRPFEEDTWEWIRIGNEEGPVFRNVKPCTRCIFTTVDPEKGVKNKNKEPITTLKSYRLLTDKEALRLEGAAPVMGINLGLYSEGAVHVGDPVYVGKL